MQRGAESPAVAVSRAPINACWRRVSFDVMRETKDASRQGASSARPVRHAPAIKQDSHIVRAHEVRQHARFHLSPLPRVSPSKSIIAAVVTAHDRKTSGARNAVRGGHFRPPFGGSAGV